MWKGKCRCFIYSAWIPSTPGALPVFRRWMACSISCARKSMYRSESHPGALSSLWPLADVDLVKVLSALGNRPLLNSSDAMEFAVMGHRAGGVDLPVSLFRVCHARQLECVKSIDSTISVHLCLRLLFSLLLCPCPQCFGILHRHEVGRHIHHPSRGRRLCECHGGCSF